MKKKKKQQSNNFSQAGFTLLEVMLVIIVTGLVFLGIYGIFAEVIRYDTESRYELVASNLAQEGVEIIKNIRDENVLVGVNDPDVEIDEGLLEGVCYPYYAGDQGRCDPSSYIAQMEKLENDGVEIYRNCSNPECQEEEVEFERACEISDIQLKDGRTDRFTVVCTVSWNSFAIDLERSVEARAVLSNWQE